jgi:hypothetical protein
MITNQVSYRSIKTYFKWDWKRKLQFLQKHVSFPIISIYIFSAFCDGMQWYSIPAPLLTVMPEMNIINSELYLLLKSEYQHVLKQSMCVCVYTHTHTECFSVMVCKIRHTSTFTDGDTLDEYYKFNFTCCQGVSTSIWFKRVLTSYKQSTFSNMD